MFWTLSNLLPSPKPQRGVEDFLEFLHSFGIRRESESKICGLKQDRSSLNIESGLHAIAEVSIGHSGIHCALLQRAKHGSVVIHGNDGGLHGKLPEQISEAFRSFQVYAFC